MRENGLKNTVLAILGTLGSFIARALGGWDSAVTLLFVMMGADLAAGVALAAIWKRSPKTERGGLSSGAAFRGAVKKLAAVVLVGIANLMDRALGLDYIRTAAVCFFIGSEGLSLLENLGLMGVPLPGVLRRTLEVLLDKGSPEETGGGDTGGSGGVE